MFALAERADVPVFFLRGNGERAAIELGSGQRSPVGEVDEWMVPAHGPELLARLASLPAALTVTVDGLGTVRLCHGSPRSDVELLTPGTSADRIAAACAGTTESIVVHGHTHLQYSRDECRPADRGLRQRRAALHRAAGRGVLDVDRRLGRVPAANSDRSRGGRGLRAVDRLSGGRTVRRTAALATDTAEIVADAEAKLFSD